ncbi:NrdR family transcriptional regulator [Tardiphaga sp. 20_F10_N6_6]|uniref:NrdR family transcriptional regulator n=1 Tax=Tardiphaga sp. 20_F10_N6_6 TaxID=3240788 RepID=UPI003F89BA58
MNCTGCNGDTQVIDSRPRATFIKRRRKCMVCGFTFNTWETTHEPADAVADARMPRVRKPKPARVALTPHRNIDPPSRVSVIDESKRRQDARQRVEDMLEAKTLSDW